VDVNSGPGLERPFYFIVVLWGERFRNYFLDYCLPSLLAPGNIPALATRQPSKFLIATVADDWAAMKATPIFRLLEQHIAPVFIEIPPCPPDRGSHLVHTNIGYKAACEMAYRDKAYATMMSPDCLFGDGMLVELQRLASQGVQMVLAASIRFGEEPFFAHLRKIGALPAERPSVTGRPLAISPRQLVLAGINGFHSETSAYLWGNVIINRGVPAVIPAAIWRVPGEDGLLLHSLSYVALLFDYAAVKRHDTSTFDRRTLDADYYHNNSGDMERIHVVQDSDQMFISSWAPLADKPFPYQPTPMFNLPYVRRIFGWQFAQSFYSGFFDATKQRLLFMPVRWHTRPLNARWAAVEKQSQRELLTYLMPKDQAIPLGIRLRRIVSYPPLLLWHALRWLARATGTWRRRSGSPAEAPG
jgi:hypothetical protein